MSISDHLELKLVELLEDRSIQEEVESQAQIAGNSI
jgi:hypothetical protein